ncbi:phospholipase D KNAG_0C01450 [Huiozyma naganishii CBS 8797]|uniref:Phospholipase D1 n=1 Tax=Huiozyma naganishii (strain ATCC MYA-139 / BCRC 22969 / CBS 8797 / KCTC 17520 / NBRC 10181 / NCYC 3082 / Yp74L-3) TaxID=1071383 RepID=J7RI96_HUIN7|nr:hypothetical protein KNAG_0C01450 [Kazachstania naganishii CBS 8797]CCK69258.1 hypothetical protein KNAG_0C01450 [Kazachstania naganishii CBS 8797]
MPMNVLPENIPGILSGGEVLKRALHNKTNTPSREESVIEEEEEEENDDVEQDNQQNNGTHPEHVTKSAPIDGSYTVDGEENRDAHSQDEATLKNLSFQGIPNSVLRRRTTQFDKPASAPTTPTLFKKGFHVGDTAANKVVPQHIETESPRASIEGHPRLDPAEFDPRVLRSRNTAPLPSGRWRRPSFLGTPASSRRSPSQSQLLFGGWTKEFGNQFRKISLKSKVKFGKGKSVAGRDENSPEYYEQELHDSHIKDMASDLVNILLSGTPAALFAGSQFLRDNNGHRRAPILLPMLYVKLSPVANINALLNAEPQENDEFSLTRVSTARSVHSIKSNSSALSKIRHHQFRSKLLFEITLEYGVGEFNYRWTVCKTYGEIEQLHHRMKLLVYQKDALNILSIDNSSHSKLILPQFPKKRTNEDGAGAGNHSGRRNSTVSASSSELSTHFTLKNTKMKQLQDLIDAPDDRTQPLHIRLEKYLRLLNAALSLRPHANRLFEFYEFSILGYYLSYETGYKGKEGHLVIRSSAKAQGWNVSHFRRNDLRAMISRHTPKWFLVRDSYLTYVSDIASNTPLDVFMVDSFFELSHSGHDKSNPHTKHPDYGGDNDQNFEDSNAFSTKLFINIKNGERKMRLICKSEFQMKQWVKSLDYMLKSSVWAGPKRFDSFAPIRKNVFAKYLVDGRDYFWSLSEMLLLAEDTIFIHDWWLSPELYMRRPVDGNQEYRIDRILKKKAEEGVKIFIIIYRNVANTVGTDSLWTKHSFLGLHKNIHLIRSPNQWLQNTYFWAHHEKFTVIDNTVAFMGGIDLCFGRYDTPDHVLRDDYEDIRDQVFPGKDYSNARVCDFFELNKPFESMYDRNVLPRMPWHDVHMMMIGDPGRDLARHFVQRWNYLLREKRPSRATPLLLPPVDFTKEELCNSDLFKRLKPRSTCEIQILRSAGDWSLGLKQTEKSIQNAYLKLISESQHYIYIENQFFITTSNWDGIVVENKIGDAIVDRIIRADTEGTNWKAFVLMPLMPGFNLPVDEPGASSMRSIMQFQYQSISRGDSSIFSRLKKLGINPLKYIQFFSLRKWSTIGPQDKLVTEQLYVHAKLLIADDRNCIIGSANINERSQLGNRDSEVAAIIRDTDMVRSRMDNKPYLAGRFAFELRQKLMREHLGCDVDMVELIERKFNKLTVTATRDYKTLNTLPDEIKSAKKQLNSAKIEIAYREVFHCDYSDSWEKKYSKGDKKDELTTFGIHESSKQETDHKDETEDVYGNNLQKKHKRGDKMSFLPSSTLRKKSLHTFNYRAGIDNTGIKSDKNISVDPRLQNNEKHVSEVAGSGPDKWNDVTPEYKESVSEQIQIWAKNVFSFKKDDNDEEHSKTTFLPFKEDLEAYIFNDKVSDYKKWDMLKRVHYLQHLDYKVKKSRTTNEASTHKSIHEGRTRDKRTSGSKQTPSNLSHGPRMNDNEINNLINRLAPKFVYEEKREDVVAENGTKKLKTLNFIDPYSFEDPISTDFFEDVWFYTAMKNTTLYKTVFHCQPDNTVQTWDDYKEFIKLYDKFNLKQGQGPVEEMKPQIGVNVQQNKSGTHTVSNDGTSNEDTLLSPRSGPHDSHSALKDITSKASSRENEKPSDAGKEKQDSVTHYNLPSYQRGNIMFGVSDHVYDKQTAHKLLEGIHGHLVIFPTEWLSKEIDSNNWFYNSDRVLPMYLFN